MPPGKGYKKGKMALKAVKSLPKATKKDLRKIGTLGKTTTRASRVRFGRYVRRQRVERGVNPQTGKSKGAPRSYVIAAEKSGSIKKGQAKRTKRTIRSLTKESKRMVAASAGKVTARRAGKNSAAAKAGATITSALKPYSRAKTKTNMGAAKRRKAVDRMVAKTGRTRLEARQTRQKRKARRKA